MAFLGLPCFLGMLYLPGKLLQLFYQTLVDEAKSFFFSFVLACIASTVPGGLLFISTGGSCTLGGLVLLLLVFLVDTIRIE